MTLFCVGSYKLPTATNCQRRQTANGDKLPTATNCQRRQTANGDKPPTATNRQRYTANDKPTTNQRYTNDTPPTTNQRYTNDTPPTAQTITIMLYSLTNTLFLLAISGIHSFWAFGGRWGADAALPTSKNGKKALNPDVFATLIVAFGLLAMALLHLEKVQIINLPIPVWINVYGLKIIAAIFLLRAIGDFRYVGFFKKIKGTKFADLDTKFYNPLCILLSFNATMTSLIL